MSSIKEAARSIVDNLPDQATRPQVSMRVVWTEPAETDLDNLFDYIARDSAVYAERFIDRILDAVATLDELPRRGRQVPEANEAHIREFIVQSQRVIYDIDDSKWRANDVKRA